MHSDMHAHDVKFNRIVPHGLICPAGVCFSMGASGRPRLHILFYIEMAVCTMPSDVLWRAFLFAPSPTWRQVNRHFYACFAHKWVRTSLVTSSHAIDRVNRWRGRIEKLDITAADEEGLCALGHLAGACPGLWSFSLVTRSSLPLHHATTLNRILQSSNVLTHFACELVFPNTSPYVNDTDSGLLCLLQIGVGHMAKTLCVFSLTLRGCGLHNEACGRIVAILRQRHMPRLHRLKICLAHNNIDERGVRELASWIASLPTFCDVTIDIAHNRGTPGKLAKMFTTALELRALSIHLGSTQNPGGYRLPLDVALNRYTQRQWLSLDFGTLQLPASSVDRTTNVQLHAGGTHGRALTEICDLLSHLGRTVADWNIGMTGDDMTDGAVSVLATYLSRCSMHHLHLDLSHSRIGPQGWTILIKSIQQIQCLRTLNFKCNHNPIGHATPAAVFESVPIVHIELRDCNIHCFDHWVAHAIRINLAAASNEWTVVLSGNDISTDQCACNAMRKAGWIVVI